MGYGCGDSFPFDFEPNEIPFGSENLKKNCHHDHTAFNVKGKGNIVFSVCPQFDAYYVESGEPLHWTFYQDWKIYIL